jgi:hypothetical protein
MKLSNPAACDGSVGVAANDCRATTTPLPRPPNDFSRTDMAYSQARHSACPTRMFCLPKCIVLRSEVPLLEDLAKE